MGVPDERLKLRVTIDQKFRENVRLSQAVSVCQSQLTPPAKVPSSPTCSSPERGSEQDSMYDGIYGKQFRAGVVEWAGAQFGEQNGYQQPDRFNNGYNTFNQVNFEIFYVMFVERESFEGWTNVQRNKSQKSREDNFGQE